MNATGVDNRKPRTVRQGRQKPFGENFRQQRTIGWMRDHTPADFFQGFYARVRAARIARGLTQAEMAQALSIGSEAYRAYEKRTPLPHNLIIPFARITGVEIEYLFTGRSRRHDSPKATGRKNHTP